MSSATDKAKGKTNEALGKGKQHAGDASGDDQLQAQGANQETKGKGQDFKGKAKDKIKNATDNM